MQMRLLLVRSWTRTFVKWVPNTSYLFPSYIEINLSIAYVSLLVSVVCAHMHYRLVSYFLHLQINRELYELFILPFSEEAYRVFSCFNCSTCGFRSYLELLRKTVVGYKWLNYFLDERKLYLCLFSGSSCMGFGL